MNETPDTPDGKKDISEVEQEIATLSILISKERKLVADGNTIDISALSDKIGVFCASIAESPPENAEGLVVLIETMVADLNSLGQAIIQRSEELSPRDKQEDKQGDKQESKQAENNGGDGS